MTRVVDRERRWRRAVAAPPDLDLLLTKFRRCFGLVQSLQRPVVALVQPPAFLDRNPHLIEYVQRDPQRAYRAFEHGRVSEVEKIAAFFEQAPRFCGLLPPLFGEINVGPARKTIFLIPRAETVAKQDDLVHDVTHRVCSALMADRPAKLACDPSSSSMRSSWLYLQTRSVRLAD